MFRRKGRRPRPPVRPHGYIPKNSTGPKDFPKGSLPPPPKQRDESSSSSENN